MVMNRRIRNTAAALGGAAVIGVTASCGTGPNSPPRPKRLRQRKLRPQRRLPLIQDSLRNSRVTPKASRPPTGRRRIRTKTSSSKARNPSSLRVGLGKAQGWLVSAANLHVMPSFDVVSEIDMQEIRNAVDQASREVGTRFDFKGTNTTIELGESEIKLAASTEDRLKAARQVLEEKCVKRQVSLKSLDWQKMEEASKGSARQIAKLVAGISTEKAKAINKFLKDAGLKGLSSQTQGEQVRVTSKKRDDLQSAIAALKDHDFDIPLQFVNFRD